MQINSGCGYTLAYIYKTFFLRHLIVAGHFRVPCASVSKRVLIRNFSYTENEFDLHENEPVGETHFLINGFARRLLMKLGNGLLTTSHCRSLCNIDKRTFKKFNITLENENPILVS